MKLLNNSMRCLSALSMMLLGLCATAQAPMQKTSYTFKQPTTPEALHKYDCSTFYNAGNSVYTVRGDKLCEFGNQILDMSMSPAGTSYIVISNEKHTPIVAVFAPDDFNDQLVKFKNKKIGDPSAAAYSVDARKIYLACGKRLNVLDSRTFAVLDTMGLPMEPKHITASDNGYFITLVNGGDVCVYNLENKAERKSFSYDEPVADAKFNDGSTEFAVLTADGVLSIYDARNFLIKKTIDDLDGGIAFDYNKDGKYVAVANGPESIVVLNLLNPIDRETIDVDGSGITDLLFLPDSQDNTLLTWSEINAINAKRMLKFAPFYGKLVADGAQEKLAEWSKRMDGESLEDYNLRVNDETRKQQLRLFEDEISTDLANNLLEMSTITLGKYDRSNQMLQVDFDNMPPILLPVPESDLGQFTDVNNLEFRNAKYGITGDDTFELIYAEVYNKADGKTYTYNNIDRVPLNFMGDDDNIVAIEVIQQQQMEEIKLQEIKEAVITEAKQDNVISDHTNIAVDSRVEPSYDSNGNKILNYKVKFTYEVDPEFTVYEDFAPGKYKAEESGAASSMLKIVKQAFEGDFAQYLKEGKKLIVNISGTADATPIVRTIKYDGCYGEFVNEPVHKDGVLTGLTVTSKEPITQNEQLAFLRAIGVQNFLNSNVEKMQDMNTDYQYYITVSEGKGSQFRRITAEFVFVDAF